MKMHGLICKRTGEIIMNTAAEEFEKKFQKEEFEMYILAESNVRSAGVSDDNFIPSVFFIASADIQTGKAVRERGDISWMVGSDGKNSEWVGLIEKLGIYKVKVRRSEKKVLSDYISVRYNSYLLTELTECNAECPELRKIAEEYMAADRSENDDAVLDENFRKSREFGGYTGFADWMGSRCMVTLESDPDGERAERSLAYFRKFCSLLPDIDSVLRAGAVTAYNSSGRKKLDEELIASSLIMNDIDVSSSGEITVYFENDELLDGGTIEVNAKYSGKVSGAAFTEG